MSHALASQTLALVGETPRTREGRGMSTLWRAESAGLSEWVRV
jgi:hypothetical protein